MRTTALALTLLSAIVPAAMAVPQAGDLDHSNVTKIAFGQQLQPGDQANHWVVWREGKSACPPLVLGPLVIPPCNTTFQLSVNCIRKSTQSIALAATTSSSTANASTNGWMDGWTTATLDGVEYEAMVFTRTHRSPPQLSA
ncbi:hypothetical protein F5Y09DRAFT_313019 [Xylaria sp. FL1042]|nr:hypothetical protein F5Y09DRAFT_313019 [Xylaria sp. FL1042]